MQMKKIVIPVLVDGASMPKRNDLPEALQNLVNYNAVVISHDRWKSDVDVLIEKLEYHLGPAPGKQKATDLSQTTAKVTKSSSLRRTVGPMVLGGFLTFVFFVAMAVMIPAFMEPDFAENIDDTNNGMEDIADANIGEKQSEMDQAGMAPPVEYSNESQAKRIDTKNSVKQAEVQHQEEKPTKVVNTGGYGLPTADEQTNAKTDYWGFEEKKSMGDLLVGTWEQTYPETPTHLREYFGADGSYANSYQKGLYYIVIQDIIQINGRNAFQVVAMNGHGTEMELKSLEGGGLICTYRKILQ